MLRSQNSHKIVKIIHTHLNREETMSMQLRPSYAYEWPTLCLLALPYMHKT